MRRLITEFNPFVGSIAEEDTRIAMLKEMYAGRMADKDREIDFLHTLVNHYSGISSESVASPILQEPIARHGSRQKDLAEYEKKRRNQYWDQKLKDAELKSEGTSQN